MKRLLQISLLTFLLFLLYPSAALAQQTNQTADQIIVKYKDGQSPAALEQKAEERTTRGKNPLGTVLNTFENLGFRIRGETPPEQKLSQIENVKDRASVSSEKKILQQADPDIVLYKVSKDSKEASQDYSSLPEVEYAAPDYRLGPPPSITGVNDPLYPQMWNLQKIHANEAWSITTGSHSILIGSIDTGVDYTHQDLPRDIINGHDFGDGDEDSMDHFPHGTQVAGIVQAVMNNNLGGTGIAPNSQILAVNVYGTHPFYSAVAQGIVYAADRGARVIYLEVQSYPGLPCTAMPYLQDAIDYARSKNAVLVSAAGNFDSDARIISPASCTGLIVVGATGHNDEREDYSNWGDPVDISAPAQDIITTGLNNTYDYYFNGTSAATPHVAATAALMLAVNPGLSPDQIERIIKDQGDYIQTDKAVGRRLNVYRSVLAASTTATSTPTPTLAVTATPTPVSADIDRNGCVGQADFEQWKDRFLNNVYVSATGEAADVNHDGVIDLLDYNAWFVAMRTLPADKLCNSQ